MPIINKEKTLEQQLPIYQKAQPIQRKLGRTFSSVRFLQTIPEEIEKEIELKELKEKEAEEDETDSETIPEEDRYVDEPAQGTERMEEFIRRQYKNLVHFLVEDWFLSAMLGVITAMFSISTDVLIEYLTHFRVGFYNWADRVHGSMGFFAWVSFMTLSATSSSAICYYFAKQAVGSGIPEVKVIIHGFVMKNYLTAKTLIFKVITLVLALGGGLPIGKEGPFVHMGAIVASLLNKATSACQYNSFFSNEGRQMEMLSSGCAVGIACTFSAPAGAVLYGIESTSKYFAVKNYWRSFFATTCSALIFRFAMAVIVPPHIAGTITAYYQTEFPNEVFVVEEIPFFAILGVLCGLAGALFVWLHRQVSLFKRKNRLYQKLFGQRPILFTTIFAGLVAVVTYPRGFGRFISGKLTFRETLGDFIANCTFTLTGVNARGCPEEIYEHWTGAHYELSPIVTLSCYIVVYFLLVAWAVTLYIPAGIFVPSFVIGAGGGRLLGELLVMAWPQGFRGIDGPQIYPGLYAVIGAAAYTGSVTHSLSIAVIVCETTGQLCALLPVLIALMIAAAVASFLQPSIYESTIKIQNYPYLADLPPSRISVHTMTVEKVMVTDVVYITRDTTYRELRELLLDTPSLRSYPFVTDEESMTLVGSVARRYLVYLMSKKLGSQPTLNKHRGSGALSTLNYLGRGSNPTMPSPKSSSARLTDRNISGNTLLAHSPLHAAQDEHSPLAPLLTEGNANIHVPMPSKQRRAQILASKLDLDEVAVDPAPFQLVKGTSLYKVHTLFSLLALNHAYVTEKGKLVGVVSLKELREVFSNIYSRGAVVPTVRKRSIFQKPLHSDSVHKSEEEESIPISIVVPEKKDYVEP